LAQALLALLLFGCSTGVEPCDVSEPSSSPAPVGATVDVMYHVAVKPCRAPIPGEEVPASGVVCEAPMPWFDGETGDFLDFAGTFWFFEGDPAFRNLFGPGDHVVTGQATLIRRDQVRLEAPAGIVLEGTPGHLGCA
jgi:hypothetical protein